MRQIRKVLRLVYELKFSQRKIATSLRISRDAVTDYLTRAVVAGLGWPLPRKTGRCGAGATFISALCGRC